MISLLKNKAYKINGGFVFTAIFLIIIGTYSLVVAFVSGGSPVTDTYDDETKIAATNQMTVDTGSGQIKLATAPWTVCGDTLIDSRDSKEYATVLIGSQCWMAESMNIGTMTAGSSDQGSTCPSAAEIEKYCYNNSESYCTSDGALYQWNQAMCGAASCNGTGAPPDDACASPVQGICPDGWHIPSHYEIVTLEKNVGSNPGVFPYDTTTVGERGTDEGTQLKVGGSSGFEALLSGYRKSVPGYFDAYGSFNIFWSSLENGTGTSAWIRRLYSDYTTVYRNNFTKSLGYSVRCIKN